MKQRTLHWAIHSLKGGDISEAIVIICIPWAMFRWPLTQKSSCIRNVLVYEGQLWSHLYIWIETRLSHHLPVFSSVKMNLIHSWCEHFLSDESRATAIIICPSVDTKYEKTWVTQLPASKSASYCSCECLPSGNETPGVSGRIQSVKSEDEVCTWDTICSVEHMCSQGAGWACHWCRLRDTNTDKIINKPNVSVFFSAVQSNIV